MSSALSHGFALGLGPHTRFLQFAAHTFDNSLEEMFTTIIHGPCVCVPSEADRLGDLAGTIEALDANFMDLMPTVAALLRPEKVPKIRGIGGEPLTREMEAWGGAVPMHNLVIKRTMPHVSPDDSVQNGPDMIMGRHRLARTALGQLDSLELA